MSQPSSLYIFFLPLLLFLSSPLDSSLSPSLTEQSTHTAELSGNILKQVMSCLSCLSWFPLSRFFISLFSLLLQDSSLYSAFSCSLFVPVPSLFIRLLSFSLSPLSSQSLSCEYAFCTLFSLPTDNSSCEVSEEKQIHITDTNYIFIFESMKCLYVLPMLYTQISWVLGGIFLTSIITKISFILAFWGFSVSPVYSPPKKFKGFWVSHFHLNNKVIHCLSFNCLFILHFIFMINDDVNFHRRRLEVSIMLIFKFLNQLKLAKW